MIYYLGYYGNMDKRFCSSPAADTLMYYIACKLSEIDKTRIVSLAVSNKTHETNIFIKNNLNFVVSPFFKGGNFFVRKVNALKRYIWIYKYLIKNFKKGDLLIVYHSLALIKFVKLLKRKLKCRVILQVCEIYGDVAENYRLVKKEMKFFQIGDAYIFSSKELNKKINIKQKENIIVHGTYNVEQQCGQAFADNKIHVVYAGTFDPRKGGVAAAAAAGLYLDERYYVHILGFGTEEERKKIIDIIDENSLQTKCTVKFEGLKQGGEYIRFLQSCDIGLSTQNPDAKFNDTSFPSKILSYMSNGLHVVSIRIPVVEASVVGNFIDYYDEQSPKIIAEAIRKVKLNDDYDGRKIIAELDKNFFLQLKKMIKKDYYSEG